MKTNKLPQSVWTDEQAAGSQSQRQIKSSTRYKTNYHSPHTGQASNDSDYEREVLEYFATYNESLIVDNGKAQSTSNVESGYKKPQKTDEIKFLLNSKNLNATLEELELNAMELDNIDLNDSEQDDSTTKVVTSPTKQIADIPERVFMNGLIKHTIIALAIIVPLAAFSAYAAPQMGSSSATDNMAKDKTTTSTLAVDPSAIIYKVATTPTTLDSVDLEQYSGTWYEIGRLPMYFQRNCDSDVTATYTGKTDGSGIIVLNQCMDTQGQGITAEGLAKPADNTGSKLKVTFLPSWIRWLPVGRADYWVLARDADYKTALVGTPDNKYLWLLARSPNISQQTYAKYRQIAQDQGYDLKEFKLTSQSKQTVNLVP